MRLEQHMVCAAGAEVIRYETSAQYSNICLSHVRRTHDVKTHDVMT